MFKGLKKKKKTAMYQITGMDLDMWRMFSAKCKLKGKTMKETLIGFIEDSIH